MGCCLRCGACDSSLICYVFGIEWSACAKDGGRESPGMRVTFFRVAERKSPKKGRPYCLRPLRCATGQPGVLGHGVHRRTRCAPLALRSDNCGESVHEACALRRACHPAPCAPQAHPEGNPRVGHPSGPSLCSAPSRGRKRLALRRRGRAQQWPVWLFGCSAPHPCWLRLRRGGCGVSMGVAAPMPRELTRRGCPSGARQRKASSTAHPATAPTQVAPSHREGVADWGSPFLW
ncbi:hypothetical protein C8C94_4474 [Acidovorax sp. 94]|nr:hypothetical protein C8C94_4474 [Acidovorax sp. 94]